MAEDAQIFKCVNLNEITMKNLTPMNFSIGEQQEIYANLNILMSEKYQLNIADLKGNSIVIYDGESVQYYTSNITYSGLGLYDDVSVWFITEQSYTDNGDDDSFTYFKFKILK